MIVLGKNATSKLYAACHMKGLEASGLGLVECISTNKPPIQKPEEELAFLIDDLWYLADGRDSPGETDIDPGDVAKLLVELDKNGKKVEQVRAWWHRHGIPGWSFTDTTTIESRLGMDYLDWIVSIVWTPNGLIGRYDQFEPKNVAKELDVVPYGVDWDMVQETRKTIEEKRKEAAQVKPRLPLPMFQPLDLRETAQYDEEFVVDALMDWMEAHLVDHHRLSLTEATGWCLDTLDMIMENQETYEKVQRERETRSKVASEELDGFLKKARKRFHF